MLVRAGAPEQLAERDAAAGYDLGDVQVKLFGTQGGGGWVGAARYGL